MILICCIFVMDTLLKERLVNWSILTTILKLTNNNLTEPNFAWFNSGTSDFFLTPVILFSYLTKSILSLFYVNISDFIPYLYLLCLPRIYTEFLTLFSQAASYCSTQCSSGRKGDLCFYCSRMRKYLLMHGLSYSNLAFGNHKCKIRKNTVLSPLNLI